MPHLSHFPRGWLWMLIGLAACTAVSTPPAALETSMRTTPGTSYEHMTLSDGTVLTYALVIPDGFDPTQPTPTLLALPPGDQSRAMIAAGLAYWETAARQRGWLVVSPAAPNGQLFFQGAEALLPEFLDRIAAQAAPEGGRIAVGGISNGGRSAFRFALDHPERVHALLALPGMPPTQADADRLARLVGIPVTLFVGEQDTGWHARMAETAAALEALGGQVSLTVVPNEGHVIQSLTGEQLFDLLDASRPGAAR